MKQTKKGLFNNLIKSAIENSVKFAGVEALKKMTTLVLTEHPVKNAKPPHPVLKFRFPN